MNHTSLFFFLNKILKLNLLRPLKRKYFLFFLIVCDSKLDIFGFRAVTFLFDKLLRLFFENIFTHLKLNLYELK